MHILKKIINRKSGAPLRLQFDGQVESDFIKFPFDCEKANSFIKSKILNQQACLITRLGASELKTVNNYIVNKLSSYEGFNPEIMWELFTHSGVFPQETQIVNEFCKKYISSIKNSDLIGVWHNRGEDFLINTLAPHSDICRLRWLEPFFSSDPWSKYLDGKKVLVVHPFEKTIISQYQNRKKLFKNEKLLPDFELNTIKAIQSLSGADKNFLTWVDAFTFMKNEIENKQFDVAIVGAGSYGLPLSAFIKEMGKVAIHLGGASQLLFGIKGNRWLEKKDYSIIMNEHWVYPAHDEKPEFGDRADGTGPYWK